MASSKHQNKTIDLVMDKIRRNSKEFGGCIVGLAYNEGRYSEYQDEKVRFGSFGGIDWTDGFWPGIFSLAYMYTRDDCFLKCIESYRGFVSVAARRTAEESAEMGYLDLGHDRGFMLSLTAVADYKLTGNLEAKAEAEEGARQLAGRFVEAGGFIRAFDRWPWETDEKVIQEKRGKAIMDTMMNLPLLMWACKETGNEHYGEIARTHADMVLKYMIRPDGSTYHHFQFSSDTMKPERGLTAQGYKDESCWSRGQAWAIYGFALMYRYTGAERYLTAAKRLGEYFMSQLDDKGLPVWDFDARCEEYCPYDSSAAAITACGMLEVYRHSGEGKYLDDAKRLISALEHFCLEAETGQALLNHGCVGPVFTVRNGVRKINMYTDTPTPYGDYFYTEALIRLNMPDMILFW